MTTKNATVAVMVQRIGTSHRIFLVERRELVARRIVGRAPRDRGYRSAFARYPLHPREDARGRDRDLPLRRRQPVPVGERRGKLGTGRAGVQTDRRERGERGGHGRL